MVETEFKDRLAEALKLSGKSAQDLWEHMKVTRQAVEKAIKGKSASFSSVNNQKAADFLGVDAKWLATGEGAARPKLARAPSPPKDHFSVPRGVLYDLLWMLATDDHGALRAGMEKVLRQQFRAMGLPAEVFDELVKWGVQHYPPQQSASGETSPTSAGRAGASRRPTRPKSAPA